MKSTTEFILIQGSFKSDKHILPYIYNGKATSEKKLKFKKQKFLFLNEHKKNYWKIKLSNVKDINK